MFHFLLKEFVYSFVWQISYPNLFAMSNIDLKFLSEALTYDDVLLVPAYSEVLPRETDFSTRLSRNISLNMPIVSAAMDTVTESNMAIAIALEGGLGFIHKNMSIEDQAGHVRRVKRSQSGLILDPITLHVESTVGDANKIMKEYRIGGIPVIDSEDRLIGIITNRDLRFQKDMSKPIKTIMTRENLVTAPREITLEEAENILQEHKIEKLPIIDKKGKLIGLITYKDILKKKDKPNACKDGFGRLRVGAAVGVTGDILERVQMLKKAGVDVICIDTAHGHSKGVIEAFKKVKSKFPELETIVGNIGTGDAGRELVKAGADAVKVGVGPGSICTTRVIAGVGVPQLSAVYEVYQAIKDSGIPIIADGGIRFSGDIVKALAAGADSVMIGSILAGTEEAPGEIIIYEGRKFKSYRGMGSIEAMEEGSKDRYFQDVEDDIKKLVPEGISGRVPFKGNASEVLYQMVGGLRAGMGYCGAKNLGNLKKAQFVKVTNAGLKESHPHDVFVTREAPNYSYKQ
jgi:IMP dehydrogenase